MLIRNAIGLALVVGGMFISSSGALGEPPGGDDRTPDARQTGEPTAAPTAGKNADAAVFTFRILDESGEPVPGRLTFIGDHGAEADLFPNAAAAPDELAVRKTIVYSRSGVGRITVPPGRYAIYASRGLEWSIDRREMELTADRPTEWTARLRHEVDTRGWISGDFHLHTLTYSGHGDSNMKERIITFLGEGLEFAVATDHNHHTDYGPTMRALDVIGKLTAVTGNEVTVPIGHFNAFPLEPDRPVPPKDAADARPLFKLIRAEPNRYGVTPVIQLNHPRYGGIDYFGKASLDPVTGVSRAETWSDDFDTVEVFNANEGWGYYDAEMTPDLSTGPSRHSVLRDWYNLLNRGRRYAAVGNSDSHTVHSTLAAYPRNFVPSGTDDPGKIDPAEVAANLRKRQAFTTIGPFVKYTANGAPMGSDVAAKDGRVDLAIRVQAASWVDCDRVKIVVNGDVLDVLSVPDTRQVVRLETKHTLSLKEDAWVTLVVEGDDSLAPIVHDQGRPIRPLAVMNPVWVDADGDGRWSSPWDQAIALAAEHAEQPLSPGALAPLQPSPRGLVLLAAAERRCAGAASLVTDALSDGERVVRLFAARAAESLAERKLEARLVAAFDAAGDDPYFAAALLRAIDRCADRPRRNAAALAYLDRHGGARVRRYASEIDSLLPGDYVRAWEAVGYFTNPRPDTLVKTAYGPESADEADATYTGKNDATVTWKSVSAAANGYVDLTKLGGRPRDYEKAIAYARTYLHVESAREVRFALGTDDGCRLWVNDALVIDDPARHRADPFQHVGALSLRRGWNHVLLKVENGGGPFGAYFRILDDAVRAAARLE